MHPSGHYVITFGVLLVATLVTSEPLHKRDVISTPAETDTLVTSQHLDKRIVNGQDAQPGSHPYIASVQMNRKKYCSNVVYSSRCSNNEQNDEYSHICGGTLIHESWVLTAAHCLGAIHDKTFFDSMRIVVGEHDMTDHSCPEQTLEVEDVIVHSGYEFGTFVNDIALIKLKQPAKTNAYVKIATVSKQDCGFVNSECIMAGWGRNESLDTTSMPDILQEGVVSVIPNEECEDKWDIAFFEKTKALMVKDLEIYIDEFGFEQVWDDFHEMYEKTLIPYWPFDIPPVNPEHVCIIDKTATPRPASACGGDSGGPLMCGPDHSVLVGVTSWGNNVDCTGEEPGVYTRVSAYLDFITTEAQIDV